MKKFEELKVNDTIKVNDASYTKSTLERGRKGKENEKI
nr:MAG TPA: hypothetical protein [Caudoviricetes sp.]